VKEGFEPSVQFPVRQFSKLILSASQAPHLFVFKYYLPFGSANIAKQETPQNKFSVF
jgi:hypothetical protein